MTTWSIRVARESTKKPLIIKATILIMVWMPGDPGLGGRVASDRAEILQFKWNDLNQFEELFRKHGDQIAGVILTPYHHPSFAPSEMPNSDF